MKIQDPLTQLLATRLSPTQLKLVNAFLRQQISDQVLERAKSALQRAYYRRMNVLDDAYEGNGELAKAEAAVTAAKEHVSQLRYARSVAVEKLVSPLWSRLETILNDARTGKLTPEQFKEAVDAFCKETDAS